MNVKYDDFMRTTQPRHHKCAQELWKRCASNGDIYLDEYTGYYLEREEVCSLPHCRTPCTPPPFHPCLPFLASSRDLRPLTHLDCGYPPS